MLPDKLVQNICMYFQSTARASFIDELHWRGADRVEVEANTVSRNALTEIVKHYHAVDLLEHYTCVLWY